MSEQHDKKQTARLAEVNHDLKASLKACHSLIDDYRLKLAANSNDLAADDGKDDESGAASAD